jgi:predicted enzyme related to lactoylglutathione lyase
MLWAGKSPFLSMLFRAGLINKNMPRVAVTGIGGMFFRANDPDALSHWYEQHLGVTPAPADYNQKSWTQQAGPTAFAPFPKDSDYFGNKEQRWMINFRVDSLDAMVEQLRVGGIEVTVDLETYPNGRFARLHDPENNPIELWQPNDIS